MLLLDDAGELWEVADEDCEAEGDGFWLAADEGEDFEEFYEFVDVEVELEDGEE